jgi:hypothetical protein
MTNALSRAFSVEEPLPRGALRISDSMSVVSRRSTGNLGIYRIEKSEDSEIIRSSWQTCGNIPA